MFNTKNIKEEIKSLIEFDLEHLGTVDENQKKLSEQIAKSRRVALKYHSKIEEIKPMPLEKFRDYLIESTHNSLTREDTLLSEYRKKLIQHQRDIKLCENILLKTDLALLKSKTEKAKLKLEYSIKDTKKQIIKIEKRINIEKKQITKFKKVDKDILKDMKKKEISFFVKSLKRENKIIEQLCSEDSIYKRNIHIIKEGTLALEELDEYSSNISEGKV